MADVGRNKQYSLAYTRIQQPVRRLLARQHSFAAGNSSNNDARILTVVKAVFKRDIDAKTAQVEEVKQKWRK